MLSMRWKWLASLVWLACAGVAAHAQQPAFRDPLLGHLAGRWLLQGTIAGKQTTHDVTAGWVLGHHYLHIHEISRERNAKGQPDYEADVYVGWDPGSNQYVCVWLDTYGGISPVSFASAKRNGNEIPFLFKDKDSTFHTTFVFDPQTGSWAWRMDGEEKGVLKPFARVKLTRKH
jgi:hypothetical protein